MSALAHPTPHPDPGVPSFLWIDGRRVDPAAPQLSALDRGFTLADGLFETMRVYAGEIFRADRHLARLRDGARTLGLALPEVPGGPARMLDEALREARAAGLRDGSVRLTVSRGVGAPGLMPPEGTRPTIVIAVTPVLPLPDTMYEHGLTARVASGRRNERALTSGIKSLGYTESVIALIAARAAGADEAIFLDTEEHVSEGSASNVFAVIDDVLVTPPLACGVLPGITRAAVLELAPSIGIGAVERVLNAPELLERASEAFLTSSLREVAPLVRVDDRPIGSGSVGPVSRGMLDAYRALVRRECAA